MRRLRTLAIASGLYFVAALAAAPLCAGQSSSSTPATQDAAQQALQQRIERLASSLEAAQSQVDQLRKEVEDLRRDLSAAKAQRVANAESATDSRNTSVKAPVDQEADTQQNQVTALREDQDVLAAEVKQHEQVKVESESKFPVRVTGLVLFNAFVNQGVVDEIDVPTSALRRNAGVSHGSVGGSMRQTWLGLEGQGPVLGRLHTSARVSLDFFGGVGGGTTSGPARIVRLRTAGIRAETESNVFEARYDEPLISPLSPASLAAVAQPALAWSGNLWTWAPELRFEHKTMLGQNRTLNFELGLRDPYMAGIQTYQEERTPSPAELGRLPAMETRLSYGSAVDPGARLSSYADPVTSGWRIGGGGYYAKQSYGSGILVHTWAITTDWQVPILRWLRLSGELYRGTGLGGLGGGAYRDVVQGTDRVTGVSRTFGLDSGGGWVQLQAVATPRMQWNAALGQDAGSGSQLRLLNLPTPSNALGFYARNRAVSGNLMYRPWNSVVLSPEFRRIWSWPISGSANVANVFTFSAGYQF
ncbi:hypothetical protein BH10ACI4_BH10ACI4_19480 [soil metagenome]